MAKKPPVLRKVRTVGSLIKQLERLPKTAKLSKAMLPVYCNTSEHAKALGLTPEVYFHFGD